MDLIKTTQGWAGLHGKYWPSMWEALGLVLPSTHTRKERQKKTKRMRRSRDTSDRKKVVKKNYNYKTHNITNRTPELKHSRKPCFEGTGNQNDAHDQTQTDRQEDNDITL